MSERVIQVDAMYLKTVDATDLVPEEALLAALRVAREDGYQVTAITMATHRRAVFGAPLLWHAEVRSCKEAAE